MSRPKRVALTGTVLFHVKGIPAWKRGVRYVSLASILILAIGLALHRYVWKNSNLDFYTAIAVSILIVIEHFLHVFLTTSIYKEFKKMLGFEDRTNEEFEKFLEEDDSEW